MKHFTQPNPFASLLEPEVVRLERQLPGPIERVWAYLTDEELRRKWLAAGSMELCAGAAFELVWRNDELTDPPGQRPENFGEEHRMTSHIVEVSAPHKLVFTWGEQERGEVCLELAPVGEEVRLTVTHRRLPRASLLGVSAGWHAHLDLLVALASDARPQPHWDHFTALRSEYARRYGDVSA
jgi:uncharacterized protein YndB with AHSA1/START domain